MSEKKKVLIITYIFPPKRNVGALRAKGLAKYLPEFGWQPIVLTSLLPDAPDPSFKVIETHPPYREKFRIIKRRNQLLQERLNSILAPLPSWGSRCVSFFREAIPFPDTKIGWRIFALEAARDIIKMEKPEAIISTSAPFTDHYVAHQLKKEFGLFWVADLQDPWSQNPQLQTQRQKKRRERAERKILHRADSLVIVSRPWADDLSYLHQREVYAIPIGFDSSDLNKNSTEVASHFTLTYTGTIYPQWQDPEPLFSVLSEAVKERSLDLHVIEVRYFGGEKTALWLKEKAEKFGIGATVKTYGIVSRETALQKQRESQLLLIFSGERGHYPAKVFEYLAAKRPILAIGKGLTVIKELLEHTNAGFYCQTESEIKDVVVRCYLEWKEKGRVDYWGNIKEVLKYSYKEMANKFAQVLDQGKS
jgi:hypothetical protein